MKKSNSGGSIFEAEPPKMIKYGHWTLLQIMALDPGTTDSGLIWKFVLLWLQISASCASNPQQLFWGHKNVISLQTHGMK